MIEALIACMVLTILVFGVTAAVTSAYQMSQAVNASACCVSLARQLVDEISAKPLADPTTGSTSLGPDAGMTSRGTFTHITNYNGYSDSSAALPMLQTNNGTMAVTGGETYSRQVSVVVGASPSIDSVSPPSDFAIVSVNTTAPNGQNVKVSEFVAKYSIPRQ